VAERPGPATLASPAPARPAGRPTVAHVITESHPFGGAQRNTLLTLQGLARRGYAVELACGPGGRLIPEAEAAGAVVHVVDALVRAPSPVQDARAFRALYALCLTRRWDVVHTHSTKAGLLGRLAAWCAGVPAIVHTVHGFPFARARGWRTRAWAAAERVVALATDRVVCVGELLRRQAAALGMAPTAKLVTVYSGLDFAACRPRRAPAEVRRALGLEAAWPVVGSVGYLVEAKAQHHLVEATALLRTRYPRIALVLCGEGPLRARLEQRSAELGVRAHVRLLGERDDVPDLLGAFDVYAMASVREGVGRALSEAMLAGLPVVTTDVAGVGELVAHEETGLLVPPRDPAALAAAIARLAEDRALAARLGAAARRRVEALMDAERMVDDLAALYERLLAARPAEDELAVWQALRRIG